MTGADLATAADVAAILAELRSLRSEVAALRHEQTPRLVSIDVAAKKTGKHASTIRRWERLGQVKSVRRGRTVLIDLDSLQPESEPERVAGLVREAQRP